MSKSKGESNKLLVGKSMCAAVLESAVVLTERRGKRRAHVVALDQGKSRDRLDISL